MQLRNVLRFFSASVSVDTFHYPVLESARALPYQSYPLCGPSRSSPTQPGPIAPSGDPGAGGASLRCSFSGTGEAWRPRRCESSGQTGLYFFRSGGVQVSELRRVGLWEVPKRGQSLGASDRARQIGRVRSGVGFSLCVLVKKGILLFSPFNSSLSPNLSGLVRQHTRTRFFVGP